MLQREKKNDLLIAIFCGIVILIFILKVKYIFWTIELFILLIWNSLFLRANYLKGFDLPTIEILLACVFLFILSIISSLILIEILFSNLPTKLIALRKAGKTSRLLNTLLFRLRNLPFKLLSGLMLVVFLITVSILSPLISTTHPHYYKDIVVTKLLPPLSKVKYLLKNERHSTIQKFDRILELKSKLILPVDDNRLFINDFKMSNHEVIYTQGKREYREDISSFITSNNKPILGEKIYYLGTDDFGRDVFSRLIYSSRISLFIGLLSVFVSFFLGAIVGFTAGYFGGILDNVFMRIVDFFFSMPILFLLIFLIAMFGNSIFLLILILGLSGWMQIARLARTETLSCKKREFIESIKLFGQSDLKIITAHILPNTISPIIVALVLQLGNVIIAESALSFLGLGVQPPTPTWGSIIKSGYDFISSAWWLTTFGGTAIVLTVLAFNLLGEGLNLYLDPRRKKELL